MRSHAQTTADRLAELQILDALHHSVIAAEALCPHALDVPLLDEIADKLLARRRELREALIGSGLVYRRTGAGVVAAPYTPMMG